MLKNSKEVTISTVAFSIQTGRCVGLDFRKSTIGSFVFATFRASENPEANRRGSRLAGIPLFMYVFISFSRHFISTVKSVGL